MKRMRLVAIISALLFVGASIEGQQILKGAAQKAKDTAARVKTGAIRVAKAPLIEILKGMPTEMLNSFETIVKYLKAQGFPLPVSLDDIKTAQYYKKAGGKKL